MTTIYVEQQVDRIFVWSCLTDSELAAVGEPFAFVRPGEKFGGLTYRQLVKLANATGVIDSDDLITD